MDGTREDTVRLVLGAATPIVGELEALRSDRIVVRCVVDKPDKLPRTGDFFLTLREGMVSGRVRVHRKLEARGGGTLLVLTLTGFDRGSEERYQAALRRQLATPGAGSVTVARAEDGGRRVTRHHWELENRFERP